MYRFKFGESIPDQWERQPGVVTRTADRVARFARKKRRLKNSTGVSSQRITSDRKALTAATAAGGVRVVKLEATFVDAVQVVDRRALHEHRKLPVDSDLDAELLGDLVGFYVKQ